MIYSTSHDVEVETSEVEFTHPRILNTKKGGLKQMKIKVTKVRSVGEDDWKIYYKFHAMSSRFCVAHNKWQRLCKYCNKCK